MTATFYQCVTAKQKETALQNNHVLLILWQLVKEREGEKYEASNFAGKLCKIWDEKWRVCALASITRVSELRYRVLETESTLTEKVEKHPQVRKLARKALSL